MSRITTTFLTLAAGLVAVGCTSSPASQVVTGRVEQASFPSPVSAVRVVRAGVSIVETTLASDGSFTVAIPAGSGYRIELVSAEQPGLVFPRTSGALDASFAIQHSTAAFELGMVRFVGDATAKNYHHSATTGDSTDDGECEDGVDQSGAVCVDDEGEEDGQCGDQGEHEDGQADDGATDHGDGDGETNDDNELPSQAAVADHNLPSSLGCDSGGDDGEQEDG